MLLGTEWDVLLTATCKMWRYVQQDGHTPSKIQLDIWKYTNKCFRIINSTS